MNRGRTAGLARADRLSKRLLCALAMSCAVALASACIEFESNSCFEQTCPIGWTCNETFQDCFSPEQTQPCIGLDDGMSCNLSGIPVARCESGVCLGNVCGNDRVDPGEVCDDGNIASGDGCNASCLSGEVCGNSVVDPATGEQCDDGNQLSHDGCSSGCTAEQASWTIVNPLNISPRYRVALSYDVARQKVVMFGGLVDTGSSAETWEYDGQTWTEVTPASSPGARFSAAMTYDVKSKRTILFGGRVPGTLEFLADTWAYDGNSWEQLLPDSAPSARLGHAMVYDAASDEVLLFGGFTSGYLADTWAFSDGQWSQKLTFGPSAREGRTLAYHTRLETVFLHGGRGPTTGGVNWLRDTWQWSGSAWTPVAGPFPVGVGEVIYDSALDRLVVTGGTTDTMTSVWDGNWSNIANNESLPGLAGTVYDVGRRVVVRVGGFTTSFGYLSDVWELNGEKWTLRDDIGAPSLRADAHLSYDTRRQRAVFFGGRGLDTVPLKDTWEWVANTWERIAMKRTPLPMSAVSNMIYDEVRETSVLLTPGAFGKMIVWESAGGQWIERTTPTTPPGYFDVALAYDVDRGVTVMIGGNVYTWEYDGSDWTPITSAGIPHEIGWQSMAYDPVHKRTLLTGSSGETWQYRIIDGQREWSRLGEDNAPSARAEAAFFHHEARGTMMLYGGKKLSSNHTNEIWELDGNVWTEVETVISPLLRETPAMTYDPIAKAGVLYGSPPVLGTWLLRYVSVHPDEVCSGSEDVDVDGLAACADPDCKSDLCGDSGERCVQGQCLCAGGAVELVCGDRFDDDCDGAVDCDDSDCAVSAFCTVESSCDNNLDDDGDGLFDCGEPQCAGVGVCEAQESSCEDGLDNDGDLLSDCRDPDCYLTPCVTVEE